MSIFKGLFHSRDKPTNSYDSPSYSYFFGRSGSGKRVSDRMAIQHTVVYACVRMLSEAIASLPLHVYKYTNNGKERVFNSTSRPLCLTAFDISPPRGESPPIFFAPRPTKSRNDLVHFP